MSIEVQEGTEVAIRRGYVKWTSPDGVFHKEPLVDHPDLLATASAREQLQAEEARRLNESAELAELSDEVAEEVAIKETLEELKAAPDDILTAAQLDETAFDSAIAERNEEVFGTEIKSGAEENSSERITSGTINATKIEAGSITPSYVRRDAEEE